MFPRIPIFLPLLIVRFDRVALTGASAEPLSEIYRSALFAVPAPPAYSPMLATAARAFCSTLGGRLT